jgi:hypothetical protein
MRHAVLDGAWKMEVHLFSLAERDKHRTRDQTTVAFGKLWAFPDIAEQDLIAQLSQFGRHIAE